MTSRTFQITALLVFFSSMFSLHAAGLPAAEKAKIESLLSHVANLTDAKFIRNGKDYDAKSAAKFLRGKWEANEKNINSANDFIAVAATKSSTSGKPYLIQLKGRPATPCADYLTTELKKLGEAEASP
jgi:Family of unknown function (DUF5329)